MLAIIGLSIVAFVLLITLVPGKLYYLIPASAVLVVSIALEFSRDKIYNPEERTRELAEEKESYERYIQEIKSVLVSCGVDSVQKRKILKDECKANMEQQAKPYDTVSSNAYNMLIGVPLGALISAIMYENNNGTVIANILELIIFGLMIVGFSKAFKALRYFSDGYFKDRYLLEILCELEYAED